MANSKPFNMAISNRRVVEKVQLWPGFRTEEQFEVVRRIVESDEFDFSCGSGIFKPSSISDEYTGPFCFTWYDKNDVLHLTRIGKRGKILTELTPV